MGARRASCVDDSDFSFRSRRAEDCAPTFFCDWRCKWCPPTLRAWICPSAKSYLTPFRSGWPREVSSLSPSTACRLARTNSTAQKLAMLLAAMKFNHERFVWHCRLCLLMPDHLHAIIAFPREPGMQTTVKNWKKFVAGKHGEEWQRDFFDHRLRPSRLEERPRAIS